MALRLKKKNKSTEHNLEYQGEAKKLDGFVDDFLNVIYEKLGARLKMGYCHGNFHRESTDYVSTVIDDVTVQFLKSIKSSNIVKAPFESFCWNLTVQKSFPEDHKWSVVFQSAACRTINTMCEYSTLKHGNDEEKKEAKKELAMRGWYGKRPKINA